MALYREDLERLGTCSVPGCGRNHRDEEIYLHARCHAGSPCWARFRGDVLTIECARCKKTVLSVVVASRASEGRGLEPPPDEEAVP